MKRPDQKLVRRIGKLLCLSIALVAASSTAERMQISGRAVVSGGYPSGMSYSDVVRPITSSTGGGTNIPQEQIPQSIFSGHREAIAKIEIEVEVDLEDRMSGCKVTETDFRVGSGRGEPSNPPEGLEALACDLFLRNVRLVHGLHHDGTRFGGSVDGAILLGKRPAASPSPPPPRIVRPRYGWLQSAVPRPIRIYEPRWSEYLPDKSSLPKSARVGLELTIRDHTVISCSVGRSSNNLIVDAASCKAILLSRVEGLSSSGLIKQSVFVEWSDKAARLQMPAPEREPMLDGEFSIPSEYASLGTEVDSVRPLVKVIAAVDRWANVTRCTLIEYSFVDDADLAACGIARKVLSFVPARDSFGDPTSGSAKLVLDWNTMRIAQEQAHSEQR